jgi:hypothetical protein
MNTHMITEAEELKRGELLAEVLGLKQIRSGDEKGRYRTTWGTKTALGLYRTVERIIVDGE